MQFETVNSMVEVLNVANIESLSEDDEWTTLLGEFRAYEIVSEICRRECILQLVKIC